MRKKYSIAEARRNLAAIVHELDQSTAVELTRRGIPVAVLVSLNEYKRLNENGKDFWDAYSEFRKSTDLRTLRLDSALEGLRDSTPVREISP